MLHKFAPAKKSPRLSITASKGADRDEAIEKILQSRNSLYEALDALNDAKTFIARTLSPSLAASIEENVLNILDGENQSLLYNLRKIEKALYQAELSYDEED